jgi:hypothetical protein
MYVLLLLLLLLLSISLPTKVCVCARGRRGGLFGPGAHVENARARARETRREERRGGHGVVVRWWRRREKRCGGWLVDGLLAVGWPRPNY